MSALFLYMQVIQFLDEAEVKKIRKILSKCTWQDGKKSALGAAAKIKSNRQIFAGAEPKFQPAVSLLEQKFLDNKYRNHFFVKAIVGLRANAYSSNDSYGWHVDMAHMSQHRTDMSFTIFLEDKANYEGGELDIQYEGFRATIKGKPGEMVTYPTGVLHRVRPVTSGERLCIVGWIESLIPSAEDRALCHDMGRCNVAARASLDSGKPISQEQADLVNQTFYKLIRHLTP